MKYLSFCLFFMVMIASCANEAQQAEEKATTVLAEVKTIAKEVPATPLEKDSTTNMVNTEDNQEDNQELAKTVADKKEEAPKEEVKKETKKERAKRKRAERRAKRKAKEAARRKAAKNGPKMKFSEKSHNFGTIMQGDEVEHIFKFTNTGKKDLVIANVSVTCGCTHPSYPFVPIAPGEEGEIKVHYNSAGKLGPQKPTVTIISNAYPKKQKIYLEGFVDAERAKPIKKTEKDTL